MAEIKYAVIKPHAIMVEFMFQGHINPFVNLATGLASKGCTITYVQTEFIHHKTRGAHGHPDSPFSEARESGLDIREMTISDGFPLDFDRDQNFVEFYESMLRDFPARVDELVGRIVRSERGGGRLRPFLVADANYMWPPEVAAKYNLVYVSFWPSPALRLSIGYNLPLLQDKTTSCSSYAKAFDNYKDHAQEIGVKSRNIRDFLKYAPSKDDPLVPEILRETIIKAHLEVRKAHFILCNTVEELESETILTLNQKQHLPTYAIGPTNFLATSSISSSLRSEVDCIEWLSCKPPSSVLFIAFGSLARIDKQVINELAHGLCISRANFLWVLRPDMVIIDDESNVLPLGFEDEVSGRGLIVPWCDQRKVLSNPAIGGFLTHCGWSSILESIWFGVPMICYPIFMDQPTNRNMVVYDWEIGINLCDKQQLSREEVVEKINSLMSGTEVGEMMRMKMKKVNKIVHNALAQNGSSNGNLDKFLKDLKEKKYAY